MIQSQLADLPPLLVVAVVAAVAVMSLQPVVLYLQALAAVLLGGMNTINIGDGNDIFGDVIGSQSIVKNYGGGMGSTSGTPYESAMGLGQGYIDKMQDNLDEYSGPEYGMKITNMGIKTALDNQYIDPAAITQNVAQRGFGLFQLGNLLNNQLYGQYQPPTPFRFDDIDIGAKDDDKDPLEDLKDLATV